MIPTAGANRSFFRFVIRDTSNPSGNWCVNRCTFPCYDLRNHAELGKSLAANGAALGPGAGGSNGARLATVTKVLALLDANTDRRNYNKKHTVVSPP